MACVWSPVTMRVRASSQGTVLRRGIFSLFTFFWVVSIPIDIVNYLFYSLKHTCTLRSHTHMHTWENSSCLQHHEQWDTQTFTPLCWNALVEPFFWTTPFKVDHSHSKGSFLLWFFLCRMHRTFWVLDSSRPIQIHLTWYPGGRSLSFWHLDFRTPSFVLLPPKFPNFERTLLGTHCSQTDKHKRHVFLSCIPYLNVATHDRHQRTSHSPIFLSSSIELAGFCH